MVDVSLHTGRALYAGLLEALTQVMGTFVSWLVLRPRASEGQRWELLSRAFDETRAGLRAARQRLRPPLEPDLDAIAARLHAEPGTRDFRVRSLGGGILKLMGSASDEADLPTLLESLTSEPGVTVVVNRAWTPASLRPRRSPSGAPVPGSRVPPSVEP